MKQTESIGISNINQMLKKSLLLLALLFSVIPDIISSNDSLNEKIIIDTDCGIDDFHAINFLLSQPEIEISAIIVSEGTLEPEDGVVKIRSLLKEWNTDLIPVICSSGRINEIPPWREFNRQLKWGSQVEDISCDDYMQVLKMLFEREDISAYSLVCMGSLYTANDILENHPEFMKQIKRIIWYTRSAKPLQGFNYDCDRSAADKILSSDNMRIDIISNLNDETQIWDKVLLQEPDRKDNKLLNIISDFHQQQAMMNLDHHQHHFLKDELVAAYILNPELFGMNINPSDIWIRYNESYNMPAIKEVMTDLLTGSYRFRKNIVFNEFPSDRKMFNYDVRQIMDSAISRHGEDEWKACIITDEFHGHLGVFSIVGAKMGIKAREIFKVGPDNLTVISYAGTIPPYSCLNDGIQVSTGATLGQGTISVARDTLTRPEAIFTYRNKSVKISLKEKYLNIINRDIREGVVKFGLMDDGYWKLVRYSALKYWLKWDRNEIFIITKL